MKRGERKYGQVPQKFLGKRKVEIPFGYFIGGHCVCARKCMYMCVYVRVYMCVTADNVCDVHMTLSYFQSICDAN